MLRQRANHCRTSNRRHLRLQRLESRELLASDLTNLREALDVNDDFRVTELDALIVVNRLAREQAAPISDDNVDYYFDVNGSGDVTAADAFRIINSLQTSVPRITSAFLTAEYVNDSGIPTVDLRVNGSNFYGSDVTVSIGDETYSTNSQIEPRVRFESSKRLYVSFPQGTKIPQGTVSVSNFSGQSELAAPQIDSISFDDTEASLSGNEPVKVMQGIHQPAFATRVIVAGPSLSSLGSAYLSTDDGGVFRLRRETTQPIALPDGRELAYFKASSQMPSGTLYIVGSDLPGIRVHVQPTISEFQFSSKTSPTVFDGPVTASLTVRGTGLGGVESFSFNGQPPLSVSLSSGVRDPQRALVATSPHVTDLFGPIELKTADEPIVYATSDFEIVNEVGLVSTNDDGSTNVSQGHSILVETSDHLNTILLNDDTNTARSLSSFYAVYEIERPRGKETVYRRLAFEQFSENEGWIRLILPSGPTVTLHRIGTTASKKIHIVNSNSTNETESVPLIDTIESIAYSGVAIDSLVASANVGQPIVIHGSGFGQDTRFRFRVADQFGVIGDLDVAPLNVQSDRAVVRVPDHAVTGSVFIANRFGGIRLQIVPVIQSLDLTAMGQLLVYGSGFVENGTSIDQNGIRFIDAADRSNEAFLQLSFAGSGRQSWSAYRFPLLSAELPLRIGTEGGIAEFGRAEQSLLINGVDILNYREPIIPLLGPESSAPFRIEVRGSIPLVASEPHDPLRHFVQKAVIEIPVVNDDGTNDVVLRAVQPLSAPGINTYFPLPLNARTGVIGVVGSETKFELVVPPVLRSVTGDLRLAGSTIEVTGTGFALDTLQVSLGGIDAIVNRRVSDFAESLQVLTITVPGGVTDGRLQLTTAGGRVTYRDEPPTIVPFDSDVVPSRTATDAPLIELPVNHQLSIGRRIPHGECDHVRINVRQGDTITFKTNPEMLLSSQGFDQIGLSIKPDESSAPSGFRFFRIDADGNVPAYQYDVLHDGSLLLIFYGVSQMDEGDYFLEVTRTDAIVGTSLLP